MAQTLPKVYFVSDKDKDCIRRHGSQPQHRLDERMGWTDDLLWIHYITYDSASLRWAIQFDRRAKLALRERTSLDDTDWSLSFEERA